MVTKLKILIFAIVFLFDYEAAHAVYPVAFRLRFLRLRSGQAGQAGRRRIRMSGFILYALVLLGTFSALKPAYGAITIRPALNLGMVGYWAMDEGAGTKINDQSGYGHNLTASNSPAWADGHLGKSLDFDGNNDFVSISDSGTSSLDITGELTISAWIKKDSFAPSGYDTIVGKINSAAEYSNYTLETYDNELEFGFERSGFHEIRTTNFNMATGTWYHLVAVYNDAANNIDLYINGATQATTVIVGNPENNSLTPNNYPLFLGSVNGTISQFDGSIDEVRIYNRALSAGEVTRLYNLTKPKIKAASDTGLVGYWSFDEGSGTQAGDSSGNRKNGTVYSSTTPAASWTAGKRGQALSLDGSNDYMDAGNVYDGVKTISFWLKPSTLTNRIIDLNGTAKVELASGIITTNGITSPTIYIDGVATSALDTNWHYVTIKTDTGINASAAKMGQGFSCGDNISFSYKGDNVTYGTVDVSGQCWMDRNLGASQVATAYNDTASYGDYFQWGRLDDGHQTSNSVTTSTLSSTDVPGHGNFILSTASPFDWRSPQNDNLWQAASSYTNNPCPSGWHIPLQAEWSTAMTNLGLASCSSNCNQALTSSALKIPSAGYRLRSSGALLNPDGYGSYWSGSPFNFDSYSLDTSPTSVSTGYPDRAYGFSARCLMHAQPTSYFSGKLDEVRMYNRALSAVEISNLYTASKKIMKVNTSQNAKLTTGLVGMWSFNGPDMLSSTFAKDITGNGYTGWLLNGPTLTSGKIGQALSFDATNDVVLASSTTIGEGSAITISAWARFNNPTNNGTKELVTKYRNFAGQQQWRLLKNRNNSDGKPHFSVWNTSGTNVIASSTAVWPTDKDWHHYVGVYDGANVYMYGDGVSLEPNPPALTGPIKSYGNYVCIGGDWTGATCSSASGGYQVDGDIDEVRIYDRALSAAEIKRLYNLGK